MIHGKPSPKSNDPWSVLTLAAHGAGCRFCGQINENNLFGCKMCQSRMDTVYAVCRKILHKRSTSSPVRGKKEEEAIEPENQREIAIKEVLDRFLLIFADWTSRFEKSLRTDGVWFAHMTAYQMMRYSNPGEPESVLELTRAEFYKKIRATIFELLSKGGAKAGSSVIETVEAVYSLPDADLDGRRVILALILELERTGRLQIARPKSTCVQCGAETRAGSGLCDACQASETKADLFLSMSSTQNPLLSRSDRSDPEPKKNKQGVNLQK